MDYNQSYSKGPRHQIRAWPFLVLLILGAVLMWRLASDGRSPDHRSSAELRTVTVRGELSDEEKATMELFKNSSPSVVHITTITRRANPFTFDIQQIPQGTGSGIIWDEQGHIVTNFHVIRDANGAQVTLADHSSWQAELVGVAPDKDIAVLRIDAPQGVLRPIPIGSSADLAVGQEVFAIGNPFGLDQSLTTGIISALGREIESLTGRKIEDVIQTDAAINPGNSGGPLLDSAGRLIAVNTAIFSPSGAYAGIGFAIPVDTVNWVVAELIEHGRIIRPGLGVQVANDALNRELGLPGLLIINVTEGSTAGSAGLQPTRRLPNGRVALGDIIVGIDDQEVESYNDMISLLERRRIGETVDVTVIRGGERVKVKVQLADTAAE